MRLRLRFALLIASIACLSILGGSVVEGGTPSMFLDVTTAAGIEAPLVGEFFTTGQAWADVDGDDCVDLFLSSDGGPNYLYRNRCDGTFEPWIHAADVALPDKGRGAVFGDFDNDGWPDLYVAGPGANVLYRNLGGQGFQDVTSAAGVAGTRVSSGATWGDYDGDGLLDLFVVNYDSEDTDLARDTLFHNQDGVFVDVTPSTLGEDRTRGPGFTARFLDYDLDGDLDLYVVNDKEYGNLLWRNDGPGCGSRCFSDVSVATGAHRPVDGMGIDAGDYDLDGDLDLYFSSSLEMVLLENQTSQGSPIFSEVSLPAGVSPATIGWGVAFCDLDADGWLDLYASTMPTSDVPTNLMFRNLGDGTFLDISDGTGGGNSTGLALADYDRDGRVDVVVGNFDEGYHLYRNLDTSTHGFLRVELEGRGPVNRDAIGALVYLTTDDGRTQMRDVRSGYSIGAGGEMALHLGLGSAISTELTVVWPDGRSESHYDLPLAGELVFVYPWVFADGFESGSVSAWSLSSP